MSEVRGKALIAKLDQLSRNVAVVMTLSDSGVDFVSCDLPDTNTLTVSMIVTYYLIRSITYFRSYPCSLGSKEGTIKLGMIDNLTLEAIKKSETARITNTLTSEANIQATELATIYRNYGMTYAQIAEKLNQTHY